MTGLNTIPPPPGCQEKFFDNTSYAVWNPIDNVLTDVQMAGFSANLHDAIPLC